MKINTLIIFAIMVIATIGLCGSASANPWWSPRSVDLDLSRIRYSRDPLFLSHRLDIVSHPRFQRIDSHVHMFSRTYPPMEVYIWSYKPGPEQWHQKLSSDHELSSADIENFVKAYKNNGAHFERLLREMPGERRRKLRQAIREHIQRQINELEVNVDFSQFSHLDEREREDGNVMVKPSKPANP